MGNVFQQLKEDLKYEIVGLLILAFAVFSIISLFTVSTDPLFVPSAGSGAVGQFIVAMLSVVAGNGKILIPLFLAYAGVKVMLERARANIINKRTIAFSIAYVMLLTFLHLQISGGLSDWQAALQGQGGGIIGASVVIILKTLFGTLGTYVVLTTLILASILLAFDLSLVRIIKKMLLRINKSFRNSKGSLSKFLFTVVEEEEKLPRNRSKKKSRRKTIEEQEKKEEHEPEKSLIIIDHRDQEKAWREEATGLTSSITGRNEPKNTDVEAYSSEDTSWREPLPLFDHRETEQLALGLPDESDLLQDKIEEKQEKRQEETLRTVDVLSVEREDRIEAAPAYQLPPLTLLNRALRLKSSRLNQDITEKVRVLEETLENFGVRVKVTQVSRGPSITRYEIQPAPGIKVSKIMNLADDIALSMASGSVRIEAPIPGKAAVGIEVPNKEISPVTFREVLEGGEYQQSSSKLTIALGKDIAGTPIVSELNRMPHLLIAGATGAGKSVCMNSLICSILFKAKPTEVKFLMVDPKMVELTQYNGIPHLIAPVVTDAKKAASTLKWIVNEMENRYELFASTGVKEISRYNQMKALENPDSTQPALPYIVVLIDELADLMMVAAVDVEDAICRLAQMARAAGIHLVVATQRPSVDVITGIIKANIPSRIAFAVSSQTDSRTILDQAGAEKLLGRGDMLFSPVGANKPMRVQGCYVSDKEVEDLVEYLKKQGLPEYQEGIIKVQEQQESIVEEEDELFLQAVQVLLENGQASISMLQRRLRIGYARAARLIDMMEQQGIVGGYEGSKPREILISKAQFESRYGISQNKVT
ncbi:FtsK/SpoIIIE family DNA translocase [Heliorestis convoluta]|uniref:DNA translocase FtsK n=1 Tax=Heliorestis convoluta TaxID=356322 RepID=A0A5Q2MZ42_9FIRM|nr:DNA translocase FtsK [Heliorestis convoluta]QGG48244.1 DNA translocase FtsK [Heliorestis convoluta]